MKTSALCSLLFLGLVLISHVSSLAYAKKSSGGGVDIALICNSCSDPVGCNKLLTSNPKFVGAKNVAQLSKVFLEMAVNKGMVAQSFFKELAQSTKNPAITQCANFDYDGVVGSFRSALGELKEDPQTANYDAKVAGDGTATCDRGLADAHVVNPDIIKINKEITLLSEVAFLITNNLS